LGVGGCGLRGVRCGLRGVGLGVWGEFVVGVRGGGVCVGSSFERL
jgi:hypothetical protein